VCRSPALLKVGQWASTRPDLLPLEWINFLSTLHEQAPAHPFEFTVQQIESSFEAVIALERERQQASHRAHSRHYDALADDAIRLAKPRDLLNPATHFDLLSGSSGERGAVDFLFEWLDPTPLGSGTIGQVHIGKLTKSAQALLQNSPSLDTGLVAVKVLHPKMKALISLDMDVLTCFAYLLDLSVPLLKWIQLPEEVHQLRLLLLSQTNLSQEAFHLAKFRYSCSCSHSFFLSHFHSLSLTLANPLS
jgi:aarF domain-containing kinase